MRSQSLALCAAALLLLCVCESSDHDVCHGEDAYGDPHCEWMRRFLSAPSAPLLREVLLVGDGDRMRFWPLWGFYRYLNRSIHERGTKPVADIAKGDGPRISLITPATPGFRRGMLACDAVALFASTPDPILYFLVSPGDEPLLLRGVRHHPGPTVLEVATPEQSQRIAQRSTTP